jgi:hypothetical protein
MGEVGGDLNLAQEPLGPDALGELRQEDLKGDVTVVLRVAGEVDDRVAAAAELALDGVAVGQRGEECGGKGARQNSYLTPNSAWRRA